MSLVIIIFLIFFILTAAILIFRSKSKSGVSQYCSSDNDCSENMRCKSNPELGGKKQCFPINSVFCKLSPATKLTQCSLVAEDSCSSCLNTPAFSCVQVDKEHPYIWKQGDTTTVIPNSISGYGWCLPKIGDRDISCNPYTSEYILADVGNNEYQWGCHCKYPNLFDHSSGPLSDCTSVSACGEKQDCGDGQPCGTLYVPTEKECQKNEDCTDGLCLKSATPYPCGYGDTNKKLHCHVPWDQEHIRERINPLSGQCQCDGTKDLSPQCIVRSSDNIEMNCVHGTCPGFTNTTTGCNTNQCYQKPDTGICNCCVCPSGYIRCPDDIVDSNQGLINYCYDTGPTCILDPCTPGYFDYKSLRCVCSKGFVIMDDGSSAVGEVCIDACKTAPCGNRGTCYVPEGGQKAQCKDCECPWTNDGDPTNTCSGTRTIPGTQIPMGLPGERCDEYAGKISHNEWCCSGLCICEFGSSACTCQQPIS